MKNISVIIPLFNKEYTIKETVNSVLNQTYPDFELLIINDGSTDKSLEIVQSIKDERIRLISKKNSGVSDARNIGIRKAQFEWVAFIDGDDIKSSNWLDEVIKAGHKYKEYNIFSTGYNNITTKSYTRYINKYFPPDGKNGVIDYIDCLCAGRQPLNSSNSVFRKSILIKNGGFKSGMRNFEDLELWMRLYHEDSVVFINKDLLTIRRDLPNRASNNVVSSRDLITYINTMADTFIRIPEHKKNKFRNYFYRYCISVFISYSKYYNKEEIKELLEAMSSLNSKILIFCMKMYYRLKCFSL